MTRTPHPTQPAQTRRTRTISRWLIAACAAAILPAAILPAAAQAGHSVNRHVLLPIVNNLHRDLTTFEQLASQRWFPDHEFEYIRLMTAKACRLADAVKCDEHFGRIRVDYDVLRDFVRVVDQRLCRHRAAKFDQQLMQLWNSIKYDVDGAACLARNECSATCGHLAPPVVVPRHSPHGAPPFVPQGPGIPPAASPLTRDFRFPDGRIPDGRQNPGRLSGTANGSRFDLQPGRSPAPDRPFDTRYGTRGDLQRQGNPTLAWLERLSAALGR